MKNLLKRRFILPVVFLLAIALVMLKMTTVSVLDHTGSEFPLKSVEYITAKNIPFRTRATAYGNVEPSVLLKAKTEVSGKISFIHPELKKGASLLKGTLVLRIEPTTFEFSLDQSKAGLSGSRSALDQLEVEESSMRRTLNLAEKNLQTGEKELARIQSVWEKRLVSRSAVDSEEQKVLQLRQQVEDLKGKLGSFNSRKSVIRSQITQSKTQLAQSQDTLGRTEIRLPFDARIGDVAVEAGEYVTTGGMLFEALGTDAVEIDAQLPIGQFYPLLIGLGKQALTLRKFEDFQAEFPNINLEARVRLVGNNESIARWDGELLRIGESVDPSRDTIGLVVSVNKPYEGVVLGRKPPLLKGMYASVEFITPPLDLLVIPRKAIHEGRVYIVGENNRLSIRSVDILHRQGELVVLNGENGIKEGEKVIITDLLPVLEGLPLKPMLAVEYQRVLAEKALGNGVSR
ncbi:MAG: hypothetical protein JKY88_02370 [Pseudomonadales bacterium]|nr:hypothetical protein [Pseudomonadales bacterium]